MRTPIASLTFVVLLLFIYSSALAATTTAHEFPSKPGELIVKLKSDAHSKSGSVFQELAQSLQKGLASKSAVKVKSLVTSTQYAVLKFQGESKAAISVLQKDARVAYAEPNYIYHTFGTAEITPADPSFDSLWGMKNTGQAELPAPSATPGQLGTPGSDIHVASAWAEGVTGSKSIKVAIIDTGIDYNHPDLKANVDASLGYNFVNNTPDALDDQNHGSHCAGTIGAVANNGVGVAGVNWNVTMIPVKFLAADGSGSADGALQAIQYATGLGVNVMSNSWGGGGYSQALYDAINDARSKGILFVAAAGNDANDNDTRPTYPGSYALDNVLAVAATDNRDALAYFSSYGKNSVHVAAPGVKILSTTANGTYGIMSGTSMATPHVSGIAALLLSANPSQTYGQIKDALIKSCDPVRQLSRKVACGGRVNTYNALHGIYPAPQGPSESEWVNVPMAIETVHPYENSKTYDFPVSVPGAKFIRVIFDSFDTEAGYDFVHITQADGEEIESLSGTKNGYVSDYLAGESANIELTTDSSMNRAGFVISHVQAVY